MDDKTLELAEKTFKAISDKMGIATTEFWPSFVRKQILDAMTVYMWTVVMLLVTLKFAPMCFYWPETPGIDHTCFFDVLKWFMRLVGLVLCIISLVCISESIDKISI